MVFDVGDHVDRAHFITEGSDGKANVQLMNQLGYDYVTIGNNEGITFSKSQLDELYREADFQVLINNLYEKNGRRPSWLHPYAVHHLGGLKIGIIGTTVDFSSFYSLLGWKIADPVQAVAENVRRLREHVDVLIVLSHLGLARDKLLAQKVPGIDLILGAHTHHFLPDGLKAEQTWIHQVGKFGRFVGHVTLETAEGKVDVYPRALAVDDEEDDPGAQALLSRWEAYARQRLSQEVAVLEEPLEADWFNESVIGNILAEALNDWCKTQIALVNSGQILAGCPAGPITKKDLHHICPHPINPCRIRLSGRQIWSVLQRSLEDDVQQLEIKGLGFRGKKLGMLSVDGLRIEYERSAQDQKNVRAIYVGKVPIQLEKWYDVATIDMFTFGAIFPEIYEQTDVRYFLPVFLRDVLAVRFQKGHLERAKKNRWACKTDRGGMDHEVH